MPAGAYTPSFEIWKGGENVTANFLNRATSIEVDLASGNGMADQCSVTVDDRDWLVSKPNVGDGIEIYLGYKEIGLAYMGVFKIDRVRFDFPPKTITIHGIAVDFRGSIKSAVTKSFTEKSVGDVMKGILEKTGYSVQVDSEIGNIKLPFFNGTTTPLGVIDQLARQYGGVIKVKDNQISVVKRDAGTSATGVTMNQIVLGPSHFALVSVEHLNRSQYSKSVAMYRDKESNEDKQVESSTKSAGFITGLGGSEGGDSTFRVKGTFTSKEQAQAAADAAMQGLDDNLGQLQCELAQGDPWLRDSQKLIIRGTRDGIDGAYMTDLVKHTYTKDGGMKTFVTGKPPNTGETAFDVNQEGTITPGVGQVVGSVLPVGTASTAPDPRVVAQ